MSSQTATAQPAHVLEVLTDPAACGRFEIEALVADDRGLSLRASPSVRLEVDHRLAPAVAGTLIEAEITLTQAEGITGAVVSGATSAVLTAGALRFALRAIAAEAEQLQPRHIERST